jgi:hypothetical protein
MCKQSIGHYEEHFDQPDYMMRQAAECDPRSFLNARPRRATKKWKMRDGTKVRICDMDNGHLTNTLRMIERAWFLRPLVLLRGVDIDRLGDMAGLAVSNGLDDELSATIEQLHPIYVDLARDALRRGMRWRHWWEDEVSKAPRSGAPSMQEFLAAQKLRRKRARRGPARGRGKR